MDLIVLVKSTTKIMGGREEKTEKDTGFFPTPWQLSPNGDHTWRWPGCLDHKTLTMLATQECQQLLSQEIQCY